MPAKLIAALNAFLVFGARQASGLFELQNQLAQIAVVYGGGSVGDRKPPNLSLTALGPLLQLCLHQQREDLNLARKGCDSILHPFLVHEAAKRTPRNAATDAGLLVCLSRGRRPAENQIVIDFEVYDQRPSDSDLLVPAIDAHQAAVGRVPYLLAADAAFYSRKNEAAARSKGVKRICVPNRSTKSPERRREQKKRWFRNGQKWRTGCEGRISVTKRRHGLTRCRYKGESGMKRWVGLGVISDNLINIGRAIPKQSL
jgi:Transposase DDE domain